jgi:hypothetical protein
MARPKADIDAAEVERMANAGAPNTMIADALGVDEATIRSRFPEIVKKARAQRRLKLLEMQWKCAESGNVAMLIFLGKNELSQRDKPEAEDGQQDEKPVLRIIDVKPPKAVGT